MFVIDKDRRSSSVRHVLILHYYVFPNIFNNAAGEVWSGRPDLRQAARLSNVKIVPHYLQYQFQFFIP